MAKAFLRASLSVAVLGSLLLAGTAVEAAASSGNATSSLNGQQNKMKTCNASATSQHLAGDARKAFMKGCLSKAPPAAVNSQQQRMKDCNAQAKTQALAGDARRQFMRNCLKGG